MPINLKCTLIAAGLVLLPFLFWALRPSQLRSVNPGRFKLGQHDPFFYWLFKPDGTPRKYTWCFAMGWVLLFLGMIWLIPAR